MDSLVTSAMMASKEVIDGWEGDQADRDGGAGRGIPDRGRAPRALERPAEVELVLRLLRGEPLDAVSRESQVPAHELEGWKRVFLEAGGRGLKSRSDPEERELTLARAKVGELTMRLELAEYLIEKRGLMDEWKRRKG